MSPKCHRLDGLAPQEVSGGYLNVAAGGRARFFASAVFMYGVGVKTISEDSKANGGCVYNEVYSSVRECTIILRWTTKRRFKLQSAQQALGMLGGSKAALRFPEAVK